MKKLVVLTGAGISAESGISTFRDAGGLWEGHDVTEVASPEGWAANPELVLDFYNQRRKNVREAQPNAAHINLAKLEEEFDVSIITQNVDDLHERGGSTHILHLHGELLKAQSSGNPRDVFHLGDKDIYMGDTCPNGYQLRPSIVWFGEAVPKMDDAIHITAQADILVVIGTSLQVYPAASLLHYAPERAAKAIIDPNADLLGAGLNIQVIRATAVNGVEPLNNFLKSVS